MADWGWVGDPADGVLVISEGAPAGVWADMWSVPDDPGAWRWIVWLNADAGRLRVGYGTGIGLVAAQAAAEAVIWLAATAHGRLALLSAASTAGLVAP